MSASAAEVAVCAEIHAGASTLLERQLGAVVDDGGLQFFGKTVGVLGHNYAFGVCEWGAGQCGCGGHVGRGNRKNQAGRHHLEKRTGISCFWEVGIGK
jgi:hypothetical protein